MPSIAIILHTCGGVLPASILRLLSPDCGNRVLRSGAQCFALQACIYAKSRSVATQRSSNACEYCNRYHYKTAVDFKSAGAAVCKTLASANARTPRTHPGTATTLQSRPQGRRLVRRVDTDDRANHPADTVTASCHLVFRAASFRRLRQRHTSPVRSKAPAGLHRLLAAVFVVAGHGGRLLATLGVELRKGPPRPNEASAAAGRQAPNGTVLNNSSWSSCLRFSAVGDPGPMSASYLPPPRRHLRLDGEQVAEPPGQRGLCRPRLFVAKSRNCPCSAWASALLVDGEPLDGRSVPGHAQNGHGLDELRASTYRPA